MALQQLQCGTFIPFCVPASNHPKKKTIRPNSPQDQYLELSTGLPPGARLFGLGESTPSGGLQVQADGRPRALWARDWGAAFPDTNLYGSHPLYMVLMPGAWGGGRGAALKC